MAEKNLNSEDSRTRKGAIFPFTAIVGQEEMKLALQLNIIDPRIGGVLIMGDRGTGKSTTIRALSDLLPEIEVVKDCPFNSHLTNPDLMGPDVLNMFESEDSIKLESDFIKIPMVDLPLGATEDRVCGTIDIEKALTDGTKSFEPGLLAKANRGILYVDEVNLLDDHLVDVLLDSAASGWNTVEREGISIRHPASFVLVGSGNPEEGELRPQLLDRFGMHAEIRTVSDPAKRVAIVNARTSFDQNQETVVADCQAAQLDLRKRLVDATNNLPKVTMSNENRVSISEVCSALKVDGLRGDIVVNRAARAYTAFNGRNRVEVSDIREIIILCLRHRLRKDPLESIDSGDKVKKVFTEVFQLDE